MSTRDRCRSRSPTRRQQEQQQDQQQVRCEYHGIDLDLQLLGGQEAKVYGIDRETVGVVLRRIAACHFGHIIDDEDGFWKLLQGEIEIRPEQSLSAQGIVNGSVITCIWQPVSNSERQEVLGKVRRFRQAALTGGDIDVLSTCRKLVIGTELLEIAHFLVELLDLEFTSNQSLDGVA